MTTTSTVTALNSTFTTLLNNVMSVEEQPLTALQTKKDSYQSQQAVYSDLGSLLNNFQDSVDSMTSTNANYAFSPQRKTTISKASSDTTVLTATASSKAIPASYQVSVTSLAREHTIRSDAQVYANQALSFSGSFLLEGNGTASISSFKGNTGTVNGTTTSDVATGKKELGSGTYFVETRKTDDGIWQFRLVDASGTAVSVKRDNGKYSSNWQAIPTTNATSYDTGRGITLNFGEDSSLYTAASKGSGAAEITYQAKGTQINIESDDTLEDIAGKINGANYAQGDEVVATILDKKLILSRKATGSGNLITAMEKDGSVLTQLGILDGGSFKNVLQKPSDAVFTVNNIQITRASNTGLTDVIQGVTMNLASDAEGEDATVVVDSDLSAEKANVNSFITSFNKTQAYLKAKLATEKNDDGTYTRGALAGDSMFQDLRLKMVQQINATAIANGTYKKLSDIGITMDDDFNLSISDSSKFEDALADDRDSVTQMMDAVMTKLKTTLSRYTGTDGYMDRMKDSVTDQIDSTNDRIDEMNTRLNKRQDDLIAEYANLQATLELLTNQSDIFTALYSSSSD
jgi:flagellar capping protein FliD